MAVVSSFTGVTALFPSTRHINHCLGLVLHVPRKVSPDIDWDINTQIKQTKKTFEILSKVVNF